MKPENPPDQFHEGVPTGSYCYGYVPKQGSGFTSAAAVYAYLQAKYADELDGMEEFLNLMETRHCKYWKPSEHGFVECTYLHRKALWISLTPEQGEKVMKYFGSEEEIEKQVEGWLLGDAVKECGLNM